MYERFKQAEYTVTDSESGLMWCRDAGISEFPLTWKEAFDFVSSLNNEAYAGWSDWRLPNRRELFSLVSHTQINPVLPANHPFINIFNGYYWSASTCARLPAQAWYVHFGGGKVYRGMKYASNMVWPVREAERGQVNILFTGQKQCFDEAGSIASCENHPLQHAAIASGIKWPEPRFNATGNLVTDHLTGLVWTKRALCGDHFLTWQEAENMVSALNRDNALGFNDWRLPDIRELESLADLGRHSPALPIDHPFSDVSDFYWSKTTSMYEERYAWALYMKDGAVGVGFKKDREFSLWPVRGVSVS